MVIADFKCPYCRHELTKEEMKKTLNKSDDTWQTKATHRLLDVYRVGDKPKFYKVKISEGSMKIHDVCPKCDKFVQAEIEIKNGKLSNKIDYSID